MASARVKASIKVMLFMVVFPYVVTYFRTVAADSKRRLPRHRAGAPSISLRVPATAEGVPLCRKP